VKTNDHEDRMDSFVLAETFKYLFLLFAEEEDLVLDMNDFLFSTEAHIFPLSLATLNITFDPRTTVRGLSYLCIRCVHHSYGYGWDYDLMYSNCGNDAGLKHVKVLYLIL